MWIFFLRGGEVFERFRVEGGNCALSPISAHANEKKKTRRARATMAGQPAKETRRTLFS